MDFENTAAFSRDYQESQECMCDSEHMFDCARSNTGNKHNVDVDELVRTFQVHIFNFIQYIKLFMFLICDDYSYLSGR